ncbi:hypothetical protein V6N13_053444 [Hibiscus sabdariffa]|uniref:Uncharacterized protein n=1 Tax=Hibiscus sabdariffa TaxID=183260 RepID=A0ABR2T7I7_9ROSI
MMKRFSLPNFVSLLLLLQVLGKSEFTQDFEASRISQETQQFFPRIPSNSDEISFLPESELPQHYETYRSPMETQYSPGSNPEETSLFPDSEFTQGSLELQDFPFETQQFSYEIDSRHKIRLSPPSPLKTPVPSPAKVPFPTNACEYKCSIKCPKEGFSLRYLCNNVCKAGCLFHYSELIFSCTNYCANLMPLTFKSGKNHSFVLISNTIPIDF